MIHPLKTDIEAPERFTYPFCYEPHPLCQLAAKEVQAYIASHPEICEDADRGKMFGVLVVKHTTGNSQKGGEAQPKERYSFLAAYSGLLAGRNDWEYFVPPVYDAQQPDGYFKTKEREISLLHSSETSADQNATEQNTAAADSSFSILHSSFKKLSQELQLWLFHQYRLLNARGEERDLVDLWQDYYNKPKLRKKFPLPPGGTGDCCAPKLLQYAYQHGLKPLCMAEFWWGAPTKEELRQHLNYYPACRGKCKPLLTWMLQGLDVDPDPELAGFQRMEIPVVYEDEWLLVVNKPSGMLSMPGRIEEYSVETVMQQRYPGSVIAHRLDMGTSGLLIVCKSLEVYRPLQEQFVKHQVKKKYLAILEPVTAPYPRTEVPQQDTLTAISCGRAKSGLISLPLRPDPMNRPRQVVDMEHGKRAVTRYEFLDNNKVALWPETGRTHQLRIHCAHPDGLGRPIVGDELYGTKGKRLMLHASEIWFCHPITGQEIHFKIPFF